MKKTIRIYEDHPHVDAFDATVLSCEPAENGTYRVVLDRSAFFPEGGGQYADEGTLNDIPVLDVQLEEGLVIHTLEKPLSEGTVVHGELDWPLRFSRMQSHSGEHIISGLVHTHFGYDNIGFHLGDDDVTCDYNGELTEEDLRMLEQYANAAVTASLPIRCFYPPTEELSSLDYRAKLDLTEDVRLVEIAGIDLCACCAPHVEHTGEIGLIKIVNSEKSHGGTRLHLRIGVKALEDYEEKQENILKIMDLCSVPQEDTAEAVAKLYEQIAALQHDLSQARTRQGQILLEALPAGQEGNVVSYLEDADADALRALANGGKETCTGVFVALTNAGNGFRYMITSSSVPLRALAKEINGALNGRGGGKDEMIQGAFQTDLESIRSYFRETKWN